MQPTLCSKCKKNVAVVFITKIENGKANNEGLCLKCARELGLKPVDDIIQKMGIEDTDLDNLTQEMTDMLTGAGELSPVDEDDDNIGETATFPFLNKLFGAQQPNRDNLPTPQKGPGSGNKSRQNPQQHVMFHLFSCSEPHKFLRERYFSKSYCGFTDGLEDVHGMIAG